MITIDMRFVKSVPDMVSQISPVFSLKPGSQEDVVINMKTLMLYPEYLAMIVSAFSWAEERNIVLKVVTKLILLS